jgi:hypothetical protein
MALSVEALVALWYLPWTSFSEIDPEDFRDYLASKAQVARLRFRNMHRVPIERLDYIASIMIRDAQRLARSPKVPASVWAE